jgi:hypothetical protein
MRIQLSTRLRKPPLLCGITTSLTDEPGAFSTTQQTLNSSSCFNFSNGDANVVAQVVNDEYLWLGAQCYGTISKGP